MGLNQKVAHYMRVAARYLADPQQLRMRRPYFLPEMYMALSKPWVQEMQIRTILDIGANVGNFAHTVRPLFPNAMVYSFEPLPEIFAEMEKNLVGMDRFQGFNFAIGDSNTELVIHESQHTPASSFLEVGEITKRAFLTSAPIINEVPVKVFRLDDLGDRIAMVAPLLIKIDVQGYELHVLNGGEQMIRQAQILLIETSFQALYKGGPLFGDIFQVLTDWGFTYQGAVETLVDPVSGIPLQEDSIFVRGV